MARQVEVKEEMPVQGKVKVGSVDISKVTIDRTVIGTYINVPMISAVSAFINDL
jgi:hypothetical protein